MKIQILLAFVISMACASARIGENADQLAKRYGKPISGEGTEAIQFKKNDIYVVAKLLKGVCQHITFSNNPVAGTKSDVFGGGFVLPGEGPATPPPQPTTAGLTEAQIQSLLEANAGGGKWQKVQDSRMVNETSSRVAVIGKHTLEIFTVEYSKYQEAADQKKAEERKGKELNRTDGF